MKRLYKYISAIIVTLAIAYVLGPLLKKQLRTAVYDHYSNKASTHIDTSLPEKPIAVVSFSYNNRQWVQKNLDSIFGQNYINYRLIYIDDASTDGTADLVAQYIKDHQQEHRTTLIRNNSWIGGASNLYYAISLCKDNEIMTVVDGDDWLKDATVFKRINTIYSTDDVWATYGQYEEWPDLHRLACEPVRWDIVKNNTFREHSCTFSHLRTCYAWLAKQVKLESFLYKGSTVLSHNDLVYMVPVMEMAGIHGRFIPEVLYVLNRQPRQYEDKSLISAMAPGSYFLDPAHKYAPLTQPVASCTDCSVTMLDIAAFHAKTSASFKEQLLATLEQLPHDYIALNLKSSSLKNISLDVCAKALKRTNAYCFYASLPEKAFKPWNEVAYTPFTKNPCTKQYAPLGNEVIAFDFEVTHDDVWKSEQVSDTLVMKKDDLQSLLSHLSFNNSAELKAALQTKPAGNNYLGLLFKMLHE